MKNSLTKHYQTVTINRGDFRLLLAVAAHEGMTTDDAGTEIADDLIRLLDENPGCPMCKAVTA